MLWTVCRSRKSLKGSGWLPRLELKRWDGVCGVYIDAVFNRSWRSGANRTESQSKGLSREPKKCLRLAYRSLSASGHVMVM